MKYSIIKSSQDITRWLLVSLLFTAAALAQSTDSEDAPTFGDVVDVRVINLEVVVTDGKVTVPGLGGEDFRLLVDGQEVPIQYFTEVRDGLAVASGESATAAVPALQPGKSVGTRYLVFIDEFFSVPSYRNRALNDLAKQLPLLGANDHMAIVAFNGNQIEMLTSWTRSQPQLERAIDQARERRAYGLERLAEQRRYETTNRFYRRGFGGTGFATAGFRGSRPTLRAEDDLRAEELYGQVAGVVDAASSTLRGFAKPDGRKVMLLLSGGWPAAAHEWVRGTFTSGGTFARAANGFNDDFLDAEFLDRDREIFHPLVATANRLGYTLYPIDINGVESQIGDAENGTLFEATLASELAFEREWIEETALRRLARATGGRAFLDGARAKALQRTIDDTRSYYWLGFSPTWREDDETHKVKVQILPKGLKARTRNSYSDLSRQTETTMLVESAQLFDLPLPDQGGFGVSLGEPQGRGRRLEVPVQLEIPLDLIDFMPEQDGFTARLELRVAATDDRGNRAEIPVVPFELRGPKAPGDGQTVVYETSLKLRQRPHRLLISLYDTVSGNLLSQRVELAL